MSLHEKRAWFRWRWKRWALSAYRGSSITIDAHGTWQRIVWDIWYLACDHDAPFDYGMSPETKSQHDALVENFEATSESDLT